MGLEYQNIRWASAEGTYVNCRKVLYLSFEVGDSKPSGGVVGLASKAIGDNSMINVGKWSCLVLEEHWIHGFWLPRFAPYKIRVEG